MKVCTVAASGKLGRYMVGHSLDRGYEVVAGCDGVLTVLVPRGVDQYSSGTAQAVLEEGESEGLPVWSRHVGDPVLKSNRTRRADFALFMVNALIRDDLVHEASALAHAGTTVAQAATIKRGSE